MFFLSQLEHKLRLPPHKLDIPLEEAIIDELQTIFLDKVISKLGLCVSVYDIKSINGGFVLPNDGAPTYTVVFRMIMFRPYVSEIIIGKIIESDSKGLRLSLGFFDDIYIPSYALPHSSHLIPDPEDPKQIKWEWHLSDEEKFIIEGDEVRFRVIAVDYPSIPLEQEEGSKAFAPMVVTGEMNMDGLGPVEWWV
ncbi:hypothetical protein RND81_09G080400 [Saponaria officinalis]|uniref:DNA-directed RNA polymerase subunit n=1 Tax=Saponaria officinalis TaxID=3572 RepID=A0AAW1IJV9_SAPOF